MRFFGKIAEQIHNPAVTHRKQIGHGSRPPSTLCKITVTPSNPLSFEQPNWSNLSYCLSDILDLREK